jgi:perosamine synthetase
MPDYKLRSEDLPQRVVGAIRSVAGAAPVVLHEPHFGGNEWTYLKECLDSTFVSSVGKFVDRFESDLASYTGAAHAVATVNGTSALHVALKLAGVVSGDEVLIPALTFAATANAVSYCGALPHFVDSERVSMGVDAVALRDWLHSIAEIRGGVCVNRSTGAVIRAVVPMHVFGHPCDLDALLAVANDYRLALVEDAAESLGSLYQGRHTGTLGLMGVLSFNGNKTITTGGGGAILTNDPVLAKRAKHLTTTAKLPHAWEYRHDEIGYNYRMPNLNAALGCAQLEQLPSFVAAKRGLHGRYQEAFAGVSGVKLIGEPLGCQSNYWLQALLLDESCADERDAVLMATNDASYMTRPVWVLMHEMPHFSTCPRMPLPVATSLAQRVINIPSSSGLQLDYS